MKHVQEAKRANNTQNTTHDQDTPRGTLAAARAHRASLTVTLATCEDQATTQQKASPRTHSHNPAHTIIQTKHETRQNGTKYMKTSEPCPRAGRTCAALHNNTPNTTHDPRRNLKDIANDATTPHRCRRRPRSLHITSTPPSRLDNRSKHETHTHAHAHKNTDSARLQQEPTRTPGLLPPQRAPCRPAHADTQVSSKSGVRKAKHETHAHTKKRGTAQTNTQLKHTPHKQHKQPQANSTQTITSQTNTTQTNTTQQLETTRTTRTARTTRTNRSIKATPSNPKAPKYKHSAHTIKCARVQQI